MADANTDSNSEVGSPSEVTHDLKVTIDSDGKIHGLPDDWKANDQVLNYLQDRSKGPEVIDYDEVSENMNNLVRHLSKKRPKNSNRQTFDGSYERILSQSTFYVPLPEGYVVPGNPNVVPIKKRETNEEFPKFDRATLMNENQIIETITKSCNSRQFKMEYTILGELGSGAAGTVFKARHKLSLGEFAVKQINVAKQARKDHLLMEITVMRELNHPSLVTYKEIFLEQKNLFIVMEFMDGGMLADIVMNIEIDDAQAAAIMKDVVQGVDHLHDHEIIHRDIKSDNILVNHKGVIKITDFGFAANLAGQTMRKTFVGTPYWMAPEVVKSQFSDKRTEKYGKKADVWSCGILGIEMIEGQPPYHKERSIGAVLKKINSNGKPPMDLSRPISSDFQSFLDSCLEYNPDQRLSAKELVDHPFLLNTKELSSLGWNNLVKKAQELKKSKSMF